MRQKKRRRRTVIEAYVGDGTTYARLGRRWGVDRSTAYRRLMRALKGRIRVIARTKRLLTKCDGICLLDGKHLRIGRRLFTIYVAWDRGLGRPINVHIREGGESDMGYWHLLVGLTHAGYAPKAFVSDGYPALKAFIAETYPDLPHQRCVVHTFMWVRSVVAPGKRKSWRQHSFVELARRILWARNFLIAKRRLEKLTAMRLLNPKEKKALAIMASALEQVFTNADARWRNLHLPRSSNAIENVMGQIEARLKTRRGTKSIAAIDALINEILLRVKRQIINQ